MIVIDNKKRMRFETEVDGEFAFLDYRFLKGDLALVRTFVPEAGRGKGLAFALAKFALDQARERNLKLLVICPVVAKYVTLHPEYKERVHRHYPMWRFTILRLMHQITHPRSDGNR